MTATARLTLAGLRRRGVAQIGVLVLVAALASAAIVAGLAAQTSAVDLVDAAYERAGHPDLVLYGPADDLRRMADDPEVEVAGDPRPQLIAGTVQIDRDPFELLLTAVDPSSPSLGQPELTEGRWPAAGSVDEVVVERSLVDDGVTAVGADLLVDRLDGSRPLHVVGAAIDLTDCFVPTCDPLRAFGSTVLVAEMGAGPTASHVAVYRLRHPDAANAVRTRLVSDPALSLRGSNIWPDTRDDILIIGSVFSAMLGGFGLFLLASACLVVAGATAARLVARRRSLGLLKAVGFRPAQLTMSVLAEHVVIGAAGVVAGWLVGSLLAPAVQPGVDGVVGDASAAFALRPLLVALVLVETFIAGSVLLPAWRAGRQPATEVLRDTPPTPNGGRWVAGLARRLGAGPSLVCGLRRAFARPVRAGLAGAAIIIAATGSIVATGFLRSADRAMADPAFAGDPYDAYAYSTGSTPAEIDSGLGALPEVDRWYTEQNSNATVGDATFSVKVIGGEVGAAEYRMQAGRPLAGAGEAMAGYGFLQETGLAVGDDLTITVEGTPLLLRIVGSYVEFDDSGAVVQVRAEAFADGAIDDPPTWRVVAAPDVSRDELAGAIADRFAGGVEAIPLALNDGGIGGINSALIAVASILAFVAFSNLVAVTVTANRERARSLGMLRTIGCTTRQLVGQAAAGAGAIGLVAGAIGLPVGVLVYRLLSDAITSGVGIGPGVSSAPPVFVLVAVIPAAGLLAAAAGGVAAATLARQPAAALVRYE